MAQVLNRSLKLPLYYQLHEILRERIGTGALAAGDMLPGEQDLAVQFGVSQITIRRALADLVRDGLVVRQPGRGTFIARAKIPDRSQRMGGFVENLRALGYRATSQILSHVWVESAEDVPGLDWLPNERVTRFERLILADEEPIAISEVTFTAPESDTPTADDLTTRSLVPIARERGINLTWADRTLEAGPASKRVALLLKIRRGVPVLITNSTIVDDVGRRRVAIHATYRGDRYKYFISVPT